MKRSRIHINGQDLSQVRTRSIPAYPTQSTVYIGRSDVFVIEDGDVLLVEAYPLTIAQLYFDGVLPQDRTTSMDVRLERRKARPYRLDSLCTLNNRWHQQVLQLRLVPA